jgi:hypothetical protein|tara:strand:- start:493 stop:702 length:210 start_codon:yes stop_codon:yes gene_type:complete
MNIKIEDNIPIPPRRRRSYLFIDNMKVGQSFAVPFSMKAQAIYRQAFKTRKFKCVTRRENNNLRVWRVA